MNSQFFTHTFFVHFSTSCTSHPREGLLCIDAHTWIGLCLSRFSAFAFICQCLSMNFYLYSFCFPREKERETFISRFLSFYTYVILIYSYRIMCVYIYVYMYISNFLFHMVISMLQELVFSWAVLKFFSVVICTTFTWIDVIREYFIICHIVFILSILRAIRRSIICIMQFSRIKIWQIMSFECLVWLYFYTKYFYFSKLRFGVPFFWACLD